MFGVRLLGIVNIQRVHYTQNNTSFKATTAIHKRTHNYNTNTNKFSITKTQSAFYFAQSRRTSKSLLDFSNFNNSRTSLISYLQARRYTTSDSEITLEGDELRDLTPYELSRVLLAERISGVLSTFTSSIMNTEEGSNAEANNNGTNDQDPQKIEPVTSYLIPYVLKGHNPIVALFPNEKHSHNLSAYNNASLTVYSLTPREVLPQEVPLPRLSMSGELEQFITSEDVQLAKLLFKEVHPNSVKYLNDYMYFKLKPDQINYYSEGLSLSFLEVDKFKDTEVDIMATYARKVIEQLNYKHKEDIINMCLYYGNMSVEDAFIYHIDRFGFNASGKRIGTRSDGSARIEWHQFRFPFPNRMHTIQELVESVIASFFNCKEEIEKLKREK